MTSPIETPLKASFCPNGPAAVLAEAYGADFTPATPSAQIETGVAAVVISGPLTHHPGRSPGCMSYDEILDQVMRACASDAHTVAMVFDSPGGDVMGNIETARAIRAQADLSKKSLVAYVVGTAASAAYALACAADRIVVQQSAIVGSIGVIDGLKSMVRANTAQGLDVVLVTSGARKADGNPVIPITEDAVAAAQARVNELAGLFHAWVAERRGLSVEQVRAYEANVVVGASAVAAKLADEVATGASLRLEKRDDTINISSVSTRGAHAPSSLTEKTMSKFESFLAATQASKYSEAMKALAEAAEEGDERAHAAMKKMAAKAKDESDPPADETDDDKKKKDDEAAAAKARTAASTPAAIAASTDINVVSELLGLKAQLAARDEAEERRTLLASRPDLSADAKVTAWLTRAPLAVVREAVVTLPKAVLPPSEAARIGAPVQVAAASTSTGLTGDEKESLDVLMGVQPVSLAKVTAVGDVMIFGGTSAQVKEILSRGK
jgi:ClpP class serine protease